MRVEYLGSRSFSKDTRGTTAAIIWLSIVPMLGMVALAVDFSAVMTAKTKLDMAADAALFTATTTAAQLYQSDPNAQQHLATILDQANTAGASRFKAQVGNAGGYIAIPVNAVVTTTEANRVITAAVTYTNVAFTLPVGFFNVTFWSLSNTVASQMSLAQPFLNVTMALDNSGSMEIGAEPSDIATLMPLTACSPAGAYYPTDKNGSSWVQSDQTTPAVTAFSAGQTYDNYSCNGSSNSYNIYSPNPPCPIPGYQPGGQPGPDCTNLPPIIFTTKTTTETVSHRGSVVGSAVTVDTTSSVTADATSTTTTGSGTRNSGKGGYTTNTSSNTSTTTLYPKAGAPCAFACHFDQSGTAGTTQDHFGVARSTICKNNQVTLRFDLIKSAVNTLLTTMSQNNASGNLQTNIFTITDQLGQVYPPSAVPNGALYGNNWSTAISDVGAPPTVANGPETGIQPYNGPNGGNTTPRPRYQHWQTPCRYARRRIRATVSAPTHRCACCSSSPMD